MFRILRARSLWAMCSRIAAMLPFAFPVPVPTVHVSSGRFLVPFGKLVDQRRRDALNVKIPSRLVVDLVAKPRNARANSW